MTKKRNIIIIGTLSLLFSIIFKAALHDHEHEHHHHSANCEHHFEHKKTAPIKLDTVSVNENIKFIYLKFISF